MPQPGALGSFNGHGCLMSKQLWLGYGDVLDEAVVERGVG